MKKLAFIFILYVMSLHANAQTYPYTKLMDFGTNTPGIVNLNVTNKLTVGSTPVTTFAGSFMVSGSNGQIGAERFGTSQPTMQFYAAGGTQTSPTAKASGETVFSIQGRPYLGFGTGYTAFPSADIDAILAQTPTSSAQGTNLVLKNSHFGSTSIPINAWINAWGGFGIGSTVKENNYMMQITGSAFANGPVWDLTATQAFYMRNAGDSTKNVALLLTTTGFSLNTTQAFNINLTSNQAVNFGTGNVNLAGLTASKLVFTDASKNLTSTGIGTSSQFIKGDGSLDANTYLPTGTASSTYQPIRVNSVITASTTIPTLAGTADYTYVANNTTQVPLILPANATLGARVSLNVLGTGGAKITWNTGDQVTGVGVSTTTGTGSIVLAQKGAIVLECQTTGSSGNTWVVKSVQGAPSYN